MRRYILLLSLASVLFPSQVSTRTRPSLGQPNLPLTNSTATNTIQIPTANCIADIRSLENLATDLAAGTAALYNFISQGAKK